MEDHHQTAYYHTKLCNLPQNMVDAVFHKERRLHPFWGAEANGLARHSFGDGAWIMKNCAKTFSGQCSIRFEEAETVFLMKCHIETHEQVETHKAGSSNFCFPR